MKILAAALLLAALPFGLAEGEGKTVEVASMPGCTQFTTVDGTPLPACAVETVTQDTTVTSLRHTGASGTAALHTGTAPLFTYNPIWTNSTTSAVATPITLPHHSSGLGTQPLTSFASVSIGTGANGHPTISHEHTSKLKTFSAEASSKSVADHASVFTKTVIVTATVTVDGTEVKTTSASLLEVSGKSSVSLPGVPSSAPAYGPPEVTKATAKSSHKSSQPAEPTPSCTVARNPHFGKCTLKDIGSKSKINGTAALVTASGFPKIYKAICDCKRIPSVSNNHTMPVPVEVCGSLMCPNEMPLRPEQSARPPVPSGPDAEKSGFKTSPKPPQATGSAAADGSGIEISSKHDFSSKDASNAHESTSSHTGTVTGRVTVNVPIPTNAISSATEALKRSSSAKAESDVVEPIWDSITSEAAELGASPTIGV